MVLAIDFYTMGTNSKFGAILSYHNVKYCVVVSDF